MKKYLVTLALTALAASPALAATHARVTRSEDPAYSAYAYAPDSDTVVAGGRIVGKDPDQAIRTQLLREGDQTMLNGN